MAGLSSGCLPPALELESQGDSGSADDAPPDRSGARQDGSGGSGEHVGCTGMCRPGRRGCIGNTPFLCDATGNNQALMPCPSVCTDGGTCAGDCKPGSLRCVAGSAGMIETCDSAGHWAPPTACTFVCDSATNECGGECLPGAPNRCSGNAVQACDASGHWKVLTNCTGVPCSKGQCQACQPNDHQCNAGTP